MVEYKCRIRSQSCLKDINKSHKVGPKKRFLHLLRLNALCPTSLQRQSYFFSSSLILSPSSSPQSGRFVSGIPCLNSLPTCIYIFLNPLLKPQLLQLAIHCLYWFQNLSPFFFSDLWFPLSFFHFSIIYLITLFTC